MTNLNRTCHGALALLLAVSAACGDDASGTPVDAPPGIDAPMVDAYVPQTTYRQIEHLGRPGIAEALLITPAYLEGYNATAPSFAAAPAAAVTAISNEAKTVLKAIFHGTCLLNGVLGLTAANGAQPGGVPCGAVGHDLFSDGNALTGTMIVQAQVDAANTYADKIFGQFITDVLRIDTSMASGYVGAGLSSLCNGAMAGSPLLCGGRLLNEDVIDITYFYLLAGAAVPVPAQTAGPVQDQVIALVTDGVFFSADNSENSGIGLGTPDPNNRNQFHQSCVNCGPQKISTTFPYSAPPR